MKQLTKFIFLLMVTSVAIMSCTECEPPTINDIVNTYSGNTLQATMDNERLGDNAEVKLINDPSNGLTIDLFNILPGVEHFSIPNASFGTATKAYVSKIRGEKSDNLLGQTISVEGEIDGKVLIITVTSAPIDATPAKDAQSLIAPYKGKMNIKVSGTPMAPLENQFIYLEEPSESGDPEVLNPATIKLKIKNFNVAGQEFGNITLDTIPVAKRGEDVYLLNTYGQQITLKNIGNAYVSINGTINNGQMRLNMKISIPTMNNMEVEVDFNGEFRTAAIDRITINSDAVLEQPAKMKEDLFKFSVLASTPAEKLLLTPSLVVPKGAVLRAISLSGGPEPTTPITLTTPIDFSVVNRVTYDFVAEGETGTTSTELEIIRVDRSISTKFSFDTWESVDGGTPAATFETPTPQSVLASSNPGVQLLCLFGFEGGFPVQKTTDAKEGSAAKLITLDTKGAGFGLAPAVTAGSLFMGKFELDIEVQLNSTKFGVEFDKKPVRFKGYYKYKSGENFVDGTDKNNVVVIPNKKDECAINAVLYEVNHYGETLTGLNINTSDHLVAIAAVVDGTEKTDYTAFDIPFQWLNGKTFDAKKKYKLTFICSSSKDGDRFMGAPGSTLCIDEFEIVAE